MSNYVNMPPKRRARATLSESAKFYRDNPEARKKKAETDKKINSRPEQKQKRREAGRERSKAERKGHDIEDKDFDHKQGRFISYKANRGQEEKSRVKGSKRKK